MNSRCSVKKPRWSIVAHFWAAIGIIVLTSSIVVFAMKRSLWVELETAVGLLSIVHLVYMFLLVYQGVRVDKDEKYTIAWAPFDLEKYRPHPFPSVDTSGAFTAAFSEGGPAGWLAGILLDIVVSVLMVIIIAFLLWLGMNIVTSGVAILSLPVFILFRHSLRVAIARGRRCRGEIGRSLAFAGWSTLLNMTWLYAVIYLGHLLYRHLHAQSPSM